MAGIGEKLIGAALVGWLGWYLYRNRPITASEQAEMSRLDDAEWQRISKKIKSRAKVKRRKRFA